MAFKDVDGVKSDKGFSVPDSRPVPPSSPAETKIPGFSDKSIPTKTTPDVKAPSPTGRK